MAYVPISVHAMLFSYSVVVESHEHYKQHNIVDIIIFCFVHIVVANTFFKKHLKNESQADR